MDNIEEQKKHGWRFVCFTAIVILLLAGCTVYIGVTPDRTYSSQERRMLSSRPKLTKKKVFKGKFQQDYETYLSEQFPGRAHWVTLQTNLARMLGNKDANGVYFGADGYLLEQYREQDFDWTEIEENVGFAADFLSRYPQAKVMFVPAKSSVMMEKLPLFAEESGEERFYQMTAAQIADESRIAVTDVLNAHDKEYIYYRTDHHWTTLGAYYAYEKWAQCMGFTAVPQEEFQIREACSTFLGTTYAKVRTGGSADTISLYEIKDGRAYELDYNLGEFQSGSFYDESKLKGDDPYSVFFGGNQALVDIRAVSPDAAGKSDDAEEPDDTESNGAEEPDGAGKSNGTKKPAGAGDGRTLMIIKDSFGNCFAPFAANHYERTIVVDLRYVNIPVSSLLAAYPADDILILYNSVQFMEDKDIYKLK